MGIPVMKGFLSKGLHLLKTAERPLDESIDATLELMARFQSQFAGVEKDEPSLEEIFCVVDLLGKEGDRAKLCAFVRNVFDAAWNAHESKLSHVKSHKEPNELVPTVGQVYFHNAARKGFAGEVVNEAKSEVCAYRAFLSQVLSQSTKIKAPDRLKNEHPIYTKSAIISLNYDTLIEDKLRAFNDSVAKPEERRYVHYGHNVVAATADGKVCPTCATEAAEKNFSLDGREAGALPLIKPHGSMNWHREAKRNMKRFHLCEKCTPAGSQCDTGSAGCSDQCLIYPTWQRDPMGGTFFDQLLTETRIHLRLASKIVIIGYSLPETDSYLKYILADAVKPPEMPTVEICNRGDESYWRQRARSVFGPRLMDANLKVLPGFLEYVRSHKDPDALDPTP